MPTLTEKTCSDCKQIKPVSAFSRRAKSLDGLQQKCKVCCAALKKDWLAKMTEVHVDHVVPLKSKFVCGLHVPANLEIIAKSDNLAKSNRVWPGMP